MSNVLIGMIGVVLFVGLALASVTYLGPRILGASANRNAQIVLGSLQQTSAAIRLYRLRTRSVVPDTTQFISRLTTAGLLKSSPPNPHLSASPADSVTAGAWPYPIYTATGTDSGVLSSSATSHTYLVMALGNSTGARSTCIEIQRHLGASTLLTAGTMGASDSFTNRRTVQPRGGCFRVASGISGIATGDYAAYLQD